MARSPWAWRTIATPPVRVFSPGRAVNTRPFTSRSFARRVHLPSSLGTDFLSIVPRFRRGLRCTGPDGGLAKAPGRGPRGCRQGGPSMRPWTTIVALFGIVVAASCSGGGGARRCPPHRCLSRRPLPQSAPASEAASAPASASASSTADSAACNPPRQDRCDSVLHLVRRRLPGGPAQVLARAVHRSDPACSSPRTRTRPTRPSRLRSSPAR